MLSSSRWNTREGIGHHRDKHDFVKEGPQQQRRTSSSPSATVAVITEEAQSAEEITELFGKALKLRLKLMPQVYIMHSSMYTYSRACGQFTPSPPHLLEAVFIRSTGVYCAYGAYQSHRSQTRSRVRRGFFIRL